jgi:hypothetical protein
VVTSDYIGTILMRWKSSRFKVSGSLICAPLLKRAQRTLILERNTRKFDLTNKIQVFHFATFLVRLNANQAILKA